MSLSVSDILRNADTFRAAYPSWPHPEPEERPMDEIKTLVGQCNGDDTYASYAEAVASLRPDGGSVCIFEDRRACGRWHVNVTAPAPGRKAG